MGKGSKRSSSRVQERRYFNVSKEVLNGRQVFRSAVQTDSKALVELGVFSGPGQAARAADLATLALGRRGPLNYVKQCYLQKDVEREREKLRQAGIVPREPRKRKTAGRSKQQPQSDQNAAGTEQPSKGVEQQAPAAPAQAEEAEQGQAAAGASKGSRKRKAASPGADVAAAAATASGRARDQQRQPGHAEEGSRPKRRRTQAAAQQASPPASGPEQVPTHKTRSRQPSPAAAPVSTALVPAAPMAALMPTGGTVQLGAPGTVNPQMLMVQLRSALAAHEHSKQQLRAALDALEASEGQLAAVARATGLQM